VTNSDQLGSSTIFAMMRLASALVTIGAVYAQQPLSIEDMLQNPMDQISTTQMYATTQASLFSDYSTTDASLLNAVLGGELGGQAVTSGNSGKPAVSVESQEIVAGIVEAFMHKVHLLPGEKTCLENSISQLTGDVVGTTKDVVDAIKALLTGNTGPSRQSGYSRSASSKSSNNLITAGIDGATKIMSLITLSTTLVKNCVQGDALVLLNRTAHHLIDMKYIGHRILVSGVDIAHCLADCIISYEGHHYHRFGVDLGTALRKIVLSNATTGAALPEGVPEEAIIQEASEGLMDGFFAGGSMMEVTDIARPDVDIRLDLHSCIAGNQPFFKEIFLAIWSAFAQFSANADQHGLQGGLPVQGGLPGLGVASNTATPKWTGELMIALMQLPMALEKCDVDEDTQNMLMEAIQTIGQLRVNVSFPGSQAASQHFRVKEITDRMAKSIEAWTNWDFKRFGLELGVLLREFVLMALPQKYTVDDKGRLRRQLFSSTRIGQQLNPNFSVYIFACATFALMAGLAATRGLRSTVARVPTSEQADVELASGTTALFLEAEQVE
jgi:hypothetical protein